MKELSKDEQTLLEQYLVFDMIDFNKGIEYLKYFLNTYDFSNPLDGSKSELVMIYFKKEKDYISISGGISVLNNGEYENRSFISKLYEKEDGIEVISFIERLGLRESYTIVDRFKKKDNNLYNRYSFYEFNNIINEHRKYKMILNEELVDNFINNKLSNKIHKTI